MTVQHTCTIHCDTAGCQRWENYPGSKLPSGWLRKTTGRVVAHFCPDCSPVVSGVVQPKLFEE